MTIPGALLRRLFLGFVAGFAVLCFAAAFYWRADVLEAALDPQQPFQTYQPPKAPDYTLRGGWALIPPTPEALRVGEKPVDVFFIASTTYNGGSDWNGPVGEPDSERKLIRSILPNYAGPFAPLARVFAPRYRQASLYAYRLTLRDDARDARKLAMGDVERAFRLYVASFNQGRPFILAGVGQGASLAARLADEIAADPQLKKRLVAVYLDDVLVPAAHYGPGAPLPACAQREEAGCVLAWQAAAEGETGLAHRLLARTLYWTTDGDLRDLGSQPTLCVNPVTGGTARPASSIAEQLGGANATGLSWPDQPKIRPHEAAARCSGGLLWHSRPRSPALRSPGSWADGLSAPSYNLFYADIEADAKARIRAYFGGDPIAPITRSIVVRTSPIHRIRN
ncbi:MAG: DUF3089 domain-containing protein [Pseudomonadota bacterium]|jgi:hypothetical protein